MYSEREQKILDHSVDKVRKLFEQYPAPAHGFKHAQMTANYAKKIAIGESCSSVFLCEMAAYLHDIGRSAEYHDLGYKKQNDVRSHHEFSYEMLQDWFVDDSVYDDLTLEEKKELLYAVRNHWNNQAMDYDTAWVLRDADKLDGFGPHGLERQKEVMAHKNDYDVNMEFRFQYDCYYWIKSATARAIIEEEKMMEPIDAYYTAYLQEKIKEVDVKK
jgi:HD superfamily phosphodiesterase